MGMIAVPLTLASTAWNVGQAQVNSQHQARDPLENMLMVVRNSYAMTLTSSSSFTMWDTAQADNISTTFTLSGTVLNKIVTQAGVSNTRAVASYVSSFQVQPMYEVLNTEGVWGSYDLPVPSVATAPFVLPPQTSGPLPSGTLVEFNVTINEPNTPQLDFTTSVSLRN